MTAHRADRTPFRLGLAEKMGAGAVVNVDETPDTAAWFLAQNEGFGFDVVFGEADSAQRRCSRIVLPSGGSTPPVTMRKGSPPVW